MLNRDQGHLIAKVLRAHKVPVLKALRIDPPEQAEVPPPPSPQVTQPQVTQLRQLVTQLELCEADTLRLLGPQYMKRFQQWRRHAQDQTRLVAFIRDCLVRTSVNGWALHQKGGLSLEAIAIGFGPPVFTQRDVDYARATLGLAATGAVIARR